MKTLMLVVVVIVGTAAPLLLMWALYQGIIGEWERFGSEQRRRGLVAGAITAFLIIVATVALIVIDPAGR